MAPIGLAFESLNLRWNPFSEPSVEDMADLAVVDVSQHVERLRRPGYAVQYLGDPGRGKSTHLMALHRHFPEAPYLRFPENEKIAKIPEAPILFLDETQRLPPRLRRRVFSRKASFAIGTHEDHTEELKKAGVESVAIWIRGLTPARLAQIIGRRIEWARRGPGAVPAVSAERINQLIAEYDDDLSAILKQLYEDFQSMQGGMNGGNRDSP